MTADANVVHLVEDDQSMRRALTRLLGGAGYTVATYASAEEFLAVAGPHLSGCLLLDLRLPGASGLELQEAITNRGCHLPVIFLTAHGDIGASVKAMKRGAVDFLQKPVVADELFAAVTQALGSATERARTKEETARLRARADALTERQREVWLRVARGELNKQIASDLGIVERTVKLHRAKVMAKLGAKSTADLVRAAERLGLTGSEP